VAIQHRNGLPRFARNDGLIVTFYDKISGMNKILPPGKLPSSLLTELISHLPTSGPEILVPPGAGCDAAGLMIGNKLVAVTTDPITFSTKNIATYSVCVNMNDIACMGARPRWYSATLLLPPETTEQTVREIWEELGNQLRKYDLISIGGHCEVTPAVSQPVIIGQMIGEAMGEQLLNPKAICPGDQIFLWQSAGIEGTALIATERETELKKYFSHEKLKAMQNLIHDPGICIWPFVEKLLPNDHVVALHDPTEGGVATALHELADAAACGIRVNNDVIPILPETAELAQLLKFDPLGLLASGSLLIVCRPDAVDAMLEKFKNQPMTWIGEFTEKPDRILVRNEQETALPRYDTDEIIKAMEAVL
jgi:hydrogenase expression/formation protein HypE